MFPYSQHHPESGYKKAQLKSALQQMDFFFNSIKLTRLPFAGRVSQADILKLTSVPTPPRVLRSPIIEKNDGLLFFEGEGWLLTFFLWPSQEWSKSLFERDPPVRFLSFFFFKKQTKTTNNHESKSLQKDVCQRDSFKEIESLQGT